MSDAGYVVEWQLHPVIDEEPSDAELADGEGVESDVIHLSEIGA